MGHIDYRALDEPTLWRLYHGDNPGALSELLRRHDLSLRKCATKLSGGKPDIADEAMQRMAARLAEPDAMQQYDPTKKWLPWAMSILKNRGVHDEMREVFRSRGGSWFTLTEKKNSFQNLKEDGLPDDVLEKLQPLRGQQRCTESRFREKVAKVLSSRELELHWTKIKCHAEVRHKPCPKPNDSGDSPVTEAIRNEREEWWKNEFGPALERFLNNLDRMEQIIFSRRLLDGRTFAQIADELVKLGLLKPLPPDATHVQKANRVSGRFNRILRKFSRYLRDEGLEDQP